jgi:hypothetical protein
MSGVDPFKNLIAEQYETNDAWQYGTIINDTEVIYENGVVYNAVIGFGQYDTYSLPNFVVSIRRQPNSNFPSISIHNLSDDSFLEIGGDRTLDQIMIELATSPLDGSIGKKIAINFMPRYIQAYGNRGKSYKWVNGNMSYSITKSNTEEAVKVTDKSGQVILDLKTNIRNGLSVDVDKGVILLIKATLDEEWRKQYPTFTALYELNNQTGDVIKVARYSKENVARSPDASTYTVWNNGSNNYLFYRVKDYSAYGDRFRNPYLRNRQKRSDEMLSTHNTLKSGLERLKTIQRAGRERSPLRTPSPETRVPLETHTPPKRSVSPRQEPRLQEIPQKSVYGEIPEETRLQPKGRMPSRLQPITAEPVYGEIQDPVYGEIPE